MTQAGAKVIVPLADLGPVVYDSAQEAIVFSLQDTGQVIDGLTATARELNRAWNPTVGGEQIPKKS